MEDSQIAFLKQEARNQAKEVRKKLHKRQHKKAGQQISNLASNLIQEFSFSIIAGFIPISTEINVIPLMDSLAKKQIQLCLPVTPKKPGSLAFRSYFLGQELEVGPLNTQHPPKTSMKVIPQLVLSPLLAFDSHFNRLGYGGGYYDRTIDEFRSSGSCVKVIGVAYSGQQVDKVPITSEDEPMDGVLTPAGLIIR